MCNNKNSPNPMTQKRKPARKPKLISPKPEPPPSPASSGDSPDRRSHQLDLFPLHPEEKEENVDHLLDSGGGATLTGVLDTAAPPSPSAAYAYRGQEREIGGGDAIMRSAMLVRTAMKRRKEGHVAEEKWVRYSEVVEEVASCSDGPSRRCSGETTAARSLSLKLDYQEVLDAWSGKGSLYIEARDGDSRPQTVPDLRDDDIFGSGFDCSDNNNNSVMDGSGSVGNVWTVPENVGKEGRSKAGQREASMLRYKEKRQNRLFSKQIRYQVRKLNAEKRPRMKGRFVKRN